MSSSYCPRWTRVPGGLQDVVVQPDERMSWPQNIAMGAQHVVAMFGSTILAPLLMAFDANVAILMSGVGTLIFFLFVRGRVPRSLGYSFSFTGGVSTFTGYAGAGPNATMWVASGALIDVLFVIHLFPTSGRGLN